MAGKAVPSSGNTGPRDFSDAVHANFARGGEVKTPPSLWVHVYLSESEREKVSAEDLFAVIADLLGRQGVDMAQSFIESWRRQDDGIPVALCTGKMPR